MWRFEMNFDLKDLVTLGIGIGVGAAGAVFVTRWTRGESDHLPGGFIQLQRTVNELKSEWKDLKTVIESEREYFKIHVENQRRSNRPRLSSKTTSSAPSFVSANTSASSEDEFEDVYSENEEPKYERITTAPHDLLYKDAPDFGGQKTAAEQLISEVDQLFLGSFADLDRALEIMKTEAPKYSNNAQVMWRLAKAKVLVAEVRKYEGDEDTQKTLVYEARDHAERAVLLDDLDAEAHKYYSITQGIISDWVPLSEAMSIGKSFKEHLERALELKPEDAYISHLYGRFIFALANMGWIQRKAVVSMYGLTESVTFDTALSWFQKAERLEPGFSNCNPFYMAECYIQLGDTSHVPELLENAISYQGNSVEEVELREKAKEMLQRYR